jgi:glucosamine 6-phosphate synthetase-like amidotransferase/phosphosugar isomerase protein
LIYWAIAVPGSVYDKVLSNAQEAKARDSRLIGVTATSDAHAAEIFDDMLPIPAVPELLLLSYQWRRFSRVACWPSALSEAKVNYRILEM